MVVGELIETVDLLVVGGGPGGYTAALRAAQLGRDVVLVEEGAIGGVCLNVGCIPSKALIETSRAWHGLGELAERGVMVADASLDRARVRQSVEAARDRLTGGVAQLLKAAGVEVVEGRAAFVGANHARVQSAHEATQVQFRQAVVATGSAARRVPGLEVDHEHILDSTDLLFRDAPIERLIVVGGGYIGLELGAAWARLGAKVTIVEAMDDVLMGAEPEVRRALRDGLGRLGVEVRTRAVVSSVEAVADGVVVGIEQGAGVDKLAADVVAVVVGREPRLEPELGLEAAGVAVADGRVVVDVARRTTNPAIFAIGDITPGPMLAHKAYLEAKVAAEAASGHPSGFDARVIPAVVFAEPEAAWAGLGEAEARARYGSIVVGRFPYRANGRAVAVGSTWGEVKVIARADGEVVGVWIVGADASNLISEAALAIEMGATLDDIALTIHPHPTLSEMLPEAAEVGLGRPTHIIVRTQSGGR
ncbi:dihydrolipoamide dehydrogenase [Acidimicrobium ferrooxidans DSM 10331]|uniref:Dihydrolipoyl dehydrogenase n=1 Tax=Acidimicrobium ferrooxidans (strain DSM 10331 / JCM 15462 / NBRC 103882 / ICP) TaxID=525909 RepID=C7LYG4_ACIFD|nr:dihydrolipoyl dehydrogenase [Acidimicrobium ferrooxidans]ACU53772.1 dihydrolipoamide dehydrogenase [Acidimicrobium ferrooxidans DSM 10331]